MGSPLDTTTGDTNRSQTNGSQTNGGQTNGGQTNGGQTNGGQTNGGRAAVILAAGGGSRFAGPAAAGQPPTHKLLALVHGIPVVRWAVSAALEALHADPVGGVDRVGVVWGAVPLDEALHGLDVDLIENPHWHGGQATSLHLGLHWAQGSRAAVVGLGDQPAVGAESWRRVANTSPDSAVAVATYSGRRGHPVRLPAAVWHAMPTLGDIGARAFLVEHPELVVEVPCEGDPTDVDTQEDLRRWN